MKKILLALVAMVAFIGAPAAAHADGCVGVKTTSIVHGKKVTTISYSCPVVTPPPSRTERVIDWD